MSQGESMEFPVSAPGADKAAQDMNRLGQSMGKSAKDWDNMSSKAGKASAALGAFGNALGPLGSQFGVLGQSISRATGIISSMTSLLGGPWAIAIGAAAIAAGVLAKKFSDAKDAADELRVSMADGWAKEVEIEKKRRADAKSARDQRARDAEAGTRDFMARMTGGGDGGGGKKGRSGGGGGFTPSATLFGEASDIKETADPFSAETNADQMRELSEGILADSQERNEALRAEESDHKAAMDSIDAMYHEQELARIAEREAAQKRLRDTSLGAAGDMIQIGIRTANEAVKGAKISGKAVMQSMGDALVARGTQAILEGTIFSATPFMWGSGGPMIAAGGVAIAAGMGLGAGSRAVGGGASPGGGVSSGATTGTTQLGPAQPVAMDRTGGNAGPTTIMVNVPTVLSASGEDGKRVVDAIEQAKREGRI